MSLRGEKGKHLQDLKKKEMKIKKWPVSRAELKFGSSKEIQENVTNQNSNIFSFHFRVK